MLQTLIGKTISHASDAAGGIVLAFTDGTTLQLRVHSLIAAAPPAPPEPAPAGPATAGDKPPPTVLGVAGIDDTTFGGAGAPSPEWVFLVNHPPFQMYVDADRKSVG